MNGKRTTAQRAQLRGDIAVLKVTGYLDTCTADALDEAIESLLASDCVKIIFDLADVHYIGSKAWSILLSKIKRVRNRAGDLKLACMSTEAYEVYQVLEFFWFLRSYDTIEDAVADFEIDPVFAQ